MPAYQDKSSKKGKAGWRWRYRFVYLGAPYSGTTPIGSNTRLAAKHMEAEHLKRLQGGVTVGKSPTLKAFAPRYLAHQQTRVKATSLRKRRLSLSKHLLPRLGAKRLEEITVKEVHKLTTELRAVPLEPQTVNDHLTTLHSILALAVTWGELVKVPPFDYLTTTKKEIEFLSEEDADRLLAAAPEQWRTMIFMAIRTGLRVGELRALRPRDVDLERGIVHVRRTDPGRSDLPGSTPKGNRSRTVPLTPDTVKALRAWLARPSWARSKDILFPSRRGGVPCDKSCAENLEWIAADAGVTISGWHTLRHTYASWLVMRGVPLRVVQQYLGHASITMTERYAHLAPDYGHASVALLDTRLARPSLQDGLNARPGGDPERND
jgi:integrase